MKYSSKVELIPGIELREDVAETILDELAKQNIQATVRALNAIRTHFPHLTFSGAKRTLDKIRKEWC